MIKVSRFFSILSFEESTENSSECTYWERVRYFTNIDNAYKYYTYCLEFGGANCALTISDGIIEHTVLSHYTNDFPESMKKSVVTCDIHEIISMVHGEQE